MNKFLAYLQDPSQAIHLYLYMLAALVLSFVLIFFIQNKKLVNTLSILPLAGILVLSAFQSFTIENNVSSSLQVQWLKFADLHINLSIVLDYYALKMIFMISFIASMVSIFSMEYMKDDMQYSRYFAYLQLFAFAMIALVLSHNLFITYMTWELVGFCSYLLIGFWTHKTSAVLANKKAFIINRIGDIGFLAGLMILLSVYNTFDYTLLKEYQFEVFKNLSIEKQTLLNLSGYCFLIAVIAKSAQFPLHVWLPDAMEGPTPISALIHAATMVIAGIYLLIRIHFILSIDVHHLIIVIASITSFMAAFIALKQYDIKKILAYSTISQLGYMLSGIGAANETAAFGHLYNHAFYKASLFLAAGSIIHAMHSQDIRNAAGLRKKIPITFIAFTLSAASLIGLPLFSGYYSKDFIIANVLDWSISRNNIYLEIAAYLNIASVFLTALYVMRLIWYLFLKNQMSSEVITESKIYRIVLLLFMPFTVVSVLPIPHIQQQNYLIIEYLPYLLISLIVLAFTILYIYYKNNKSTQANFIWNLSSNELYIVQFYQNIIVKFIVWKSKLIAWFDVNILDAFVNFIPNLSLYFSRLIANFDKYVVDATVNYTALLSKRIGDFLRAFQTGKTQSYFALSMLLLFIIIWILKS